MSNEISTFPEVASMLSIKSKKVGVVHRYPCPHCQKMDFEANEIFGHCWNCDYKANYISYYASWCGISTKDATKEISNKTGRNIGEYISINTTKKEEPIASIETRHNTYSSFLSTLTLSKNHLNNLISRGLSEERIEELGYKSFSTGKKATRFDIAKKLIDNDITLNGVPGFYMDSNKWIICWRKNGILVPYRSRNNLIQGFQIRKDDSLLEVDEDGKKENKYDWISSKDREMGCKARGFTHYACDFYHDFATDVEEPFLGREVYLTEGAMKADIIHFLSHKPVIAVPGVKNLLELQKELPYLIDRGVETVYDCFDMDYIKNKDVAKASEKIKMLFEDIGISYVRKTWDESYKGLDDFLLSQTKKENS